MEARRDILMQAQQPISWKKNQAQISKVVDVSIEQHNPATGESIGRSARFAPEVDGVVYVRGNVRLGSMVPVAIDDADVYDLYGHVATAADLVQRQPARML
jgi:ribosomal protein S12 methylthiotransferase